MVKDGVLYVRFAVYFSDTHLIYSIDPTDSDDGNEVNDQDEDGEERLPEVILDDEGYATLPSRHGISLRGQQELVRIIFHASYSKFVSFSIIY